MIVDRRNLDPMVAQRLQDRVYFLRDQHKIAGDRRLATAGRLKIDRISRTHRRRNIHIAVFDRFRARDAELINTAAVRALGTERGYLELGRVTGDPRYAGYSEAALAPWSHLPDP